MQICRQTYPNAGSTAASLKDPSIRQCIASLAQGIATDVEDLVAHGSGL